MQAAEYALERGIIIADTKFEFGIDRSSNEIVLVDEVLTPDSSRFWPAAKYEVGRPQKSLDKVRRRGDRSCRYRTPSMLTKVNSNICEIGSSVAGLRGWMRKYRRIL